MGGLSTSSYNISNGFMAWEGSVVDVPSLDAPGFCKVMTHGAHEPFPDISLYTHLTVTVRCHAPYAGYKIDFRLEICLTRLLVTLNFGCLWHQGSLVCCATFTAAP